VAELDIGRAIDMAIEDSMAADKSIILMGEDVALLRAPIYARFGAERVFSAPISESAFLGAAAGAAMGGLRPVVELYMVDFIAVAFDALLNHIAKLEVFSGGAWRAPLLIRAPSGGWYGDGGQHGQSLWGILAGIPGITVAVPSTPADAYGLVTNALAHDGPVVLLEPKLLSEDWLGFLGRCGRDSVSFDVPELKDVSFDKSTTKTPFGKAIKRSSGKDLTICSVAVGVYRSLEAAERLAVDGISCEVIDLRSLRPIDTETVVESVRKTGALLVVDEDYREFGLSGELAAIALEAGLSPKFSRVCVSDTIPFAREREEQALPNTQRIYEAASSMLKGRAKS
jgi:pyruvate dehydrogenase E1 component beta subunit